MHQDKAPESVWAAPEPTKRRLRLFRRDPEAPTLWQSEFEQQDLGEPLGLWATAETVALVRFDRVTAYAPATGEPRWTWQPPGQDVIVRVAEDAQDGLGVVLHHDDGEHGAQHVRVTALALGSGAVAWSREQPKDRLGHVGRRHAREVAIGGGRIATVARGKADAPPVVRCLDARTGAQQWERPLPDDRGDSFSVLAADPPVLSVRNSGRRSRPRLYVVREDGEWYVELPDGYKDFGPAVAVVGDTLAVGLEPDAARRRGREERRHCPARLLRPHRRAALGVARRSRPYAPPAGPPRVLHGGQRLRQPGDRPRPRRRPGRRRAQTARLQLPGPVRRLGRPSGRRVPRGERDPARARVPVEVT